MAEKSITRKERCLFTGQQAFLWGTIATFYAYIIVMFTKQDLPSEQIGYMAAIMMLGCTIGQFCIPYMSDRIRSCKIVFIIVAILLEACCLGIYYVKSLIPMYMLLFLAGFCKQPLGTVLDTWTMRNVHGDMQLFGGIRSGGSLGYATVNLVYGLLLTQYGFSMMPWVSLIFTGILVTLCVIIPEKSNAVPQQKRDTSGLALRKAIVPLLLFFASMTILGMINNSVYNLFPEIINEFGKNEMYWGIACFFNAGMEAPAMWIKWEKLGLRSPGVRLAVAIVLYVISSVMIAYFNSIVLILVGFTLSGFAFGMQLHAKRAFVAERSPDTLHTTMHGIGDMLYFGVGGVVGSAMLGVLLSILPRADAMMICGAFQMLSLVLFLLMMRKDKTHFENDKTNACLR